jgi:GTPase SAR1 family protein
MKTLRSNIILGYKELTEHLDTLKKPPKLASDAKDSLEYFRKKNPFDTFDDDTKKNSSTLWDDKGFQKLWAQRDTISNFSIMHLDYLMTHLDRLSKDEAPTTEDVLFARKRTTGTNEIEFNFKGKDFRFVDVGGQKSERRHWDQIIERPDAVVFFVALTDWNLPTVGNPEITKMQEAMDIFKEVMEFEAFLGTFWILMLNKVDLFREKILRVSLKETFPDYEGEEKDGDEAAKFIRDKFSAMVPQDRIDSLQSHVTCALDTEQMKTVFGAMQTAVLERLMSSFGML